MTYRDPIEGTCPQLVEGTCPHLPWRAVPGELVEGFAIETEDGLIFTVKGLLHPPDRVIAYLRYMPDPAGDRWRAGVRYRRLYHFEEQVAVLQARYPHYLYDDPVCQLRVQAVPRTQVHAVHDPCAYLADLQAQAATGPPDGIKAHALQLATLLEQAAGVPTGNIGISGSLMLGTQREASDIDLLVYGTAAGRAVQEALIRLLNDPSSPVRRPNPAELAALHAAHRPDTPLSFDDFCRSQARKVNEGRYQGREYFVRFVKWPTEVEEKYGDRRFQPLGRVTVRMRVTDERDALFTPCSYSVERVIFLDGAPVDNLEKTVSFRGRFSAQVRAGERATAQGSLERVIPQNGGVYHRLVVGGQAGDYLLAQQPEGT
jgi:uncharacterized protein